MKSTWHYTLLLISIFFFIASVIQAQSPVVINEVMVSPIGNPSVNSFYNGDTLSGADPTLGAEWVELYNPDPCHSADIGCFVLGCETSQGTGQNWGSVLLPGGTTIPPLGHYLIGGSNVPNADYTVHFSNASHCSSHIWCLKDSAGYIGLYNNLSNPVSIVYWNINGSAADITILSEYGTDLSTNPNSCTCCAPAFFLNPKDYPNSEFAGNVISNSSITLARKSDGSPVWVQGPVNGTPNSCNNGPDSCFSWNADISLMLPTCLNGNDGSLSANIYTVGYPQSPYTYNWSDGQTTQTATNLNAGNYSITVTDKWGCKIIVDTVLINPVPPILSIISNSPVCPDDNLTLNCNLSGTNYSWAGPDSFSSASDNPVVSNFQTSNVGTYSVTITDTNGCTLTSTTTIQISPLPVFSLGTDTTVCLHQPLTYDVNNGNGFTYLWFNGATTPTNIVYDGISPVGQNPFWTWVTISGCKSLTDSVLVEVSPCDIESYNVLTPNGDNMNDVFRISGLEKYPNSSLLIFNRWGKKIYENANYQNDWDGGKCPDGVYYFILSVTDGEEIHGEVTILGKK